MTEPRDSAAERQFEQLLEFAPDAVVGIDAAGRIVLVNRQVERVFGYEREELLGQPVERLVPERFHDVHVSHRGRYFADPRTRPMGADLALFAMRKDGTEFPAEISLSSIEIGGGPLAVASIRDITERRSAERRFEQLLEAAPDAIVGVDDGGRIMLVNQQVERVFGYGREELLGERVEVLVPERFRRAHVMHRGGYFADPGTRPMGADLALFGLRKDGTEFPAEISLSSIESGSGTLAITSIRDVTERLVAESVTTDEVHRREIVAAMLQAEEAERARIATSLHDDTIQVMTASLIAIDRVLKRACADEGLVDALRRARETIEQATERTRRLTFELRPAVLHEQGMAPAITAMVDPGGRGARRPLDRERAEAAVRLVGRGARLPHRRGGGHQRPQALRGVARDGHDRPAPGRAHRDGGRRRARVRDRGDRPAPRPDPAHRPRHDDRAGADGGRRARHRLGPGERDADLVRRPARTGAGRRRLTAAQPRRRAATHMSMTRRSSSR